MPWNVLGAVELWQEHGWALHRMGVVARLGTLVGTGREASIVVLAGAERAGEGSSSPSGCQCSPFRARLERQKQ